MFIFILNLLEVLFVLVFYIFINVAVLLIDFRWILLLDLLFWLVLIFGQHFIQIINVLIEKLHLLFLALLFVPVIVVRFLLINLSDLRQNILQS